AYIIDNADVKVLFVGEQPQFDAAVSIFEQCEQLELIVAMSDDIELGDHDFTISWKDFVAKGDTSHQAELDERLEQAKV
ncbi:long-chain fatty acid--CoA ligase, partial [Escherichia coli]|nr:long-chain fatty acid--CoA ligase [Escherichia coli]